MKKRLNAATRKPDILKHFLEVILEEGIEGASIGKVARRMAIHPSLIIHYFENKENMIAGLVDYVMKEYARLLQGLQLPPADPEERLRLLIDTVLSEEWYRMTDISVDFSVIAMSFRHHGIKARIQEMYGQFKILLARECAPLVEKGIIKVSDPETAAELLISFMEGYRHFKHFYVAQEKAGPFRQEMAEKILAALKN